MSVKTLKKKTKTKTKVKAKTKESRLAKRTRTVSTVLECGKKGLRVALMHGTRNKLCTCGDKDCQRPGKHLRTRNGIADLTSETENIIELWSQYPKAKIAIETRVDIGNYPTWGLR